MSRLSSYDAARRDHSNHSMDMTALAAEGRRHCSALEPHATPLLLRHLRHLGQRFGAIEARSRDLTAALEATHAKPAIRRAA